MPSPVDRKDDILQTEMPPRKRLCLSTLGSKYEVKESFTARPTEGQGIDFGFVSNLDAKARRRGIREVGNNGGNPKGNGCFEYGATGYFKKDYPKLKNKNEGKVNVPGWVYVVGNAEKRGNASRDPDTNVITGTFLLNNRYASILFDTGADRSFISTAFSSLIDIIPTLLGNSYDVELKDGKIVGRSFQKALGTDISMSTAYHPETDGQIERTMAKMSITGVLGRSWRSSTNWPGIDSRKNGKDRTYQAENLSCSRSTKELRRFETEADGVRS
nr:hypothetical protein [Tanacetum cinerariifolium]